MSRQISQHKNNGKAYLDHITLIKKITNIFVLLGGIGVVAGKATLGILVSSAVLLNIHLYNQPLGNVLVLLYR